MNQKLSFFLLAIVSTSLHLSAENQPTKSNKQLKKQASTLAPMQKINLSTSEQTLDEQQRIALAAHKYGLATQGNPKIQAALAGLTIGLPLFLFLEPKLYLRAKGTDFTTMATSTIKLGIAKYRNVPKLQSNNLGNALEKASELVRRSQEYIASGNPSDYSSFQKDQFVQNVTTALEKKLYQAPTEGILENNHSLNFMSINNPIKNSFTKQYDYFKDHQDVREENNISTDESRPGVNREERMEQQMQGLFQAMHLFFGQGQRYSDAGTFTGAKKDVLDRFSELKQTVDQLNKCRDALDDSRSLSARLLRPWTDFHAKRSKSTQSALSAMTTIGKIIYVSFILPKAISSLKKSVNRLVNGTQFSKVEYLMIRYIANKHLLSSDLQEAVTKQLLSAEESQEKFDKAINFVENVLALPTTIKQVKYDNSAAEEIFSSYREEVREQLMSFCFDAANQSQGNNQVIFLHGLPGTGKSNAGKLIGKVLDLPVACISLAGLSVKDLEGESAESGTPKPGALAQALIDTHRKYSHAWKNMIIIFDDFDRVLNSDDPVSVATRNYMLKLLDPAEKRSFSSPYFQTEIELPTNVILTGNSLIGDAALSMRMNNVFVSGFTKQTKTQVLWEQTIPALLNRYQGLNLENMPEVCKQTIHELIELDQDHGFRNINILLARYISDVARYMQFHEASDLTKLRQRYVQQMEKMNERLKTMTYNLPSEIFG